MGRGLMPQHTYRVCLYVDSRPGEVVPHRPRHFTSLPVCVTRMSFPLNPLGGGACSLSHPNHYLHLTRPPPPPPPRSQVFSPSCCLATAAGSALNKSIRQSIWSVCNTRDGFVRLCAYVRRLGQKPMVMARPPASVALQYISYCTSPHSWSPPRWLSIRSPSPPCLTPPHRRTHTFPSRG